MTTFKGILWSLVWARELPSSLFFFFQGLRTTQQPPILTNFCWTWFACHPALISQKYMSNCLHCWKSPTCTCYQYFIFFIMSFILYSWYCFVSVIFCIRHQFHEKFTAKLFFGCVKWFLWFYIAKREQTKIMRLQAIYADVPIYGHSAEMMG